MTAHGVPLFGDRTLGVETYTLTHGRFIRFQVVVVAVLAALGLVFAVYPTLAGLDLSGMEGFGLAGANAEDPEMAGAAPADQRLRIALFGALGLFNLNAEGSFATWWSSMNLLLAAALCLMVARRAGLASRFHAILWAGLGIVMLCLSIDEVAQIHERANKAQFVFGVLFEGVPTRPWVILGGAFAGLVAVASLPLLLALPRKVAGLIVLSGALFVAGAVGLEVVAARLEDGGASIYGLPVMMLILAEETLEMSGIALFNIVLFTQLAPRGVSLRFPPGPAPASPAE